MSQGKYSPTIYNANPEMGAFIYNAKGEIPPMRDPTEPYITEIHLDNYNEHGYDSYGYSAYDEDGNYVDIGAGVDSNGYTEMDYLVMTAEEYDNASY